jgi:hypothetical protein
LERVTRRRHLANGKKLFAGCGWAGRGLVDAGLLLLSFVADLS